MEILLVTVFFVTYAAITLEHQTGVNKSCLLYTSDAADE